MKKILSFILASAMLISAAVLFSAAESAPTLKEHAEFVLSLDGTYVFGTNGPVTAEKVAAQFDGDAVVISPKGDTLTGSAAVPTGSTVGTLSVLVSGDANADGKINVSDVTTVLKKIAAWDVACDVQAADADMSGKTNLSDVTLLLKYLANWDVTLGNVKIVVDETAQTASAEDSTISLWFEHSNVKLWQDDVVPTDESTGNTYVIRAAKNEIEDCALYIASENAHTVIPSITEFRNCYGETVDTDIYTYWYVKMRRDPFDNVTDPIYGPDALIPTSVTPSTVKRPVETPVYKVKAGTSQGFQISASTTAETRPGLYEATVSLKEGTKELKRAKVYLDVWDFTLEDADAPGSSFGMGKYVIPGWYGIDGNDHDAVDVIYKKTYDYFLKNRINLCLLPYDIDDDRCDEYLSSDRVRSFLVAGAGYGGAYDKTDEQIASYYEKLSKNDEWFEKGYFYYVDEPLTFKNPSNPNAPFEEIITANNKIQSLFPGGKQLVPLTGAHDSGIIFPENLFDDYYDYCQIWCPRVWNFTDTKYFGYDGAMIFSPQEWLDRNGTYVDALEKRLADPDSNVESWWYLAAGPWQPYISFHAEDDGLAPRTCFWQQMQYRVEGVLYYAVDGYNAISPYRDIDYVNGAGRHSYGNGILVYPGAQLGIMEPVGSLRVEYIRDGIEDFMYLRMIERAFGEDVMDEYVSRISNDLLEYNEDPGVLMNVRREMGDALEDYFAK